MCGIAGFRLSDEDMKTMDGAAIVAALGLGIQHRGKDAAGVMTVSSKGRIKVRKAEGPMDLFLARHNGLGSGAKLTLIHTRAWTQGTPEDNRNNHPIQSGGIIGVHNGWINNDDWIWKDYPLWERKALVDSEVLFAAIDHLGTKPGLEEVCGAVACAWINEDEPLTLNVAKADNPVFIVESKNGSIFFASTAEAVVAGARAAGLDANVKDHATSLVVGDVLVAHDDKGATTLPNFFKPWSYSYYSSTTTKTVTPIKSSDDSVFSFYNKDGKGASKGHLPTDFRTDSYGTYDSYDEWYQKEEALFDEEAKVGYDPDLVAGAPVFVMTDRNERMRGIITDIYDGEAVVEWECSFMPLTSLDFDGWKATKSGEQLSITSGGDTQ